MLVLLRGLWSEAVVLLGFGAVGFASSSFSDSDVAEKSVGIRCCSSLLGLRPSLEDFFFPNFCMIGFLKKRGVAFCLLCQIGKMGVGRRRFLIKSLDSFCLLDEIFLKQKLFLTD